MKKRCVIIMTAMLSLVLWGCSVQDYSQYNEETNQYEVFQGVKFQIPKSWEKKTDAQGYWEYAEKSKEGETKNRLILTFDPKSEIDKKAEESWNSLENASAQNNDIKNSNQSSDTIAGMAAIKMEYSEDGKSGKSINKLILLEAPNGLIYISFYSLDKIGQKDFDKVIKSIAVE